MRSVEICMGWHRTGHLEETFLLLFVKVNSLPFGGFSFTTAGKCRCVCSLGSSLMVPVNSAEKNIQVTSMFFPLASLLARSGGKELGKREESSL